MDDFKSIKQKIQLNNYYGWLTETKDGVVLNVPSPVCNCTRCNL